MSYYLLVLAGVGYLLGSIPFSYIVSQKLGHVDIRTKGSGNAGATNVYRVLGRKVGLIAFVGDFLKGCIAAGIGYWLAGSDGAAVCATVAVVGHCLPFTLGFKGGKGVATSAGMVMATQPLIGLIVFVVHFTTLKTIKIMSLSSIIAAILLPILAIVFNTSDVYVGCTVFLSCFVIYRHRSNIQKILKGEENKFNF